MVNKKKGKPLFDYSNLNIYRNINIFYAFNQFSSVYNTKGNMKTLTESFQRQFIIRDFKQWVKTYAASFYPRSGIFLLNNNDNNNNNNKKDDGSNSLIINS